MAQAAILSQNNDTPWMRRLRTLARNQMAMTGLAILVIWAFVALAAPIVATYDPLAQNITDRLISLGHKKLLPKEDLSAAMVLSGSEAKPAMATTPGFDKSLASPTSATSTGPAGVPTTTSGLATAPTTQRGD